MRHAIAVVVLCCACGSSERLEDSRSPVWACNDSTLLPLFSSDSGTVYCEVDRLTEPSPAYPDGKLVTSYCSSQCSWGHVNAIRIGPDGPGCEFDVGSGDPSDRRCAFAACTRLTSEYPDVFLCFP